MRRQPLPLVGRHGLGIELLRGLLNLLLHRFLQMLDVGEPSPYRQADRYGDRIGL